MTILVLAVVAIVGAGLAAVYPLTALMTLSTAQHAA